MKWKCRIILFVSYTCCCVCCCTNVCTMSNYIEVFDRRWRSTHKLYYLVFAINDFVYLWSTIFRSSFQDSVKIEITVRAHMHGQKQKRIYMVQQARMQISLRIWLCILVHLGTWYLIFCWIFWSINDTMNCIITKESKRNMWKATLHAAEPSQLPQM